MRYLIAESSWETMSLAHVLLEGGILLTRTDRPEDLFHFMECGNNDLIVLDAAQMSKSLRVSDLRARAGRTPVCLLARKPGHSQVAQWLDAGADLVIDMSEEPAEIAARLNAVARRRFGLCLPEVVYGDLHIDLAHHRVHVGNVTLSLSPKLYEILEYVALRPGTLVTREELLSHVYGLEDEPAPRVFDVYMCNLRSQLASVNDTVAIETVRGAGYRFDLLTQAEPMAA